MNKKEALAAVEKGSLVECTAVEYKEGIRAALQDYAGRMIDSNIHVRAQIALQEVRRLDKRFDSTEEV